jgi:methylaspartate ammonia-lyase
MSGNPTNSRPQTAEYKPSEEAASSEPLAITAMRSHFIARRDRAMANLSNYIITPVGVGEHPDTVEECIKLIEEIDHADSVLETIQRI